MKSSRLMSILMLLQGRDGMSAQQLATELEVSVRTIYRDVEALQFAGVPIYSDRGPLGGYRLVKGWKTKFTGLTTGEAEALFLTGLPGPAAEMGLGPVVAAVQHKVLASLSTDLRHRAAGLRDRFHLDAPAWFQDSESAPFLVQVSSALWEDRRITVRYMSWDGEVRRTLDPHGLILKSGQWYLAARATHGFRNYRVSRILELEVLDETFIRDPEFDLPTFWTDSAMDFEKTLFQREAVVLVSRRGLTELGLRISEPAAKRAFDSAEPSGRAGWQRVRLPIISVDDAVPELLQLGADAVVEEPSELRDRMVQAIEDMRVAYATAVGTAHSVASAV
jgi:predicted DNA-binding transcriptional regulator YafY